MERDGVGEERDGREGKWRDRGERREENRQS